MRKLDEMHLKWPDYITYVREIRENLGQGDNYYPPIHYTSRMSLRQKLSDYGFTHIDDVEIPGTIKNGDEYDYSNNWQHLYQALFRLDDPEKVKGRRKK